MDTILDHLYEDYQKRAPDAYEIWQWLEERGEQVHCDHIALRGFSSSLYNCTSLATFFEKMGYHIKDFYDFPEKKLHALYLGHENATWPRVFISELRVEDCPAVVQDRVHAALGAAPDCHEEPLEEILTHGRYWPLGYAEYAEVAAVSEYAGWVLAHGICVNHFTIDINALNTFAGINEFCEELEMQGYLLNKSGGMIKGSEETGLMQASTMAPEVAVQFDDIEADIPGCYVEFAQRFVSAEGEQFDGFIAAQANKIFESTNTQ